MSTAAEILYGSPLVEAPIAVESSDSAPDPIESIEQIDEQPAPDPVQPATDYIQTIADSVPEAVREARNSIERKLYDSEHQNTLSLQDVAEKLPNLSPEIHEAILKETRAIYSDLGLSAVEARDMINAGKNFDATIPVPTLADQTIEALNKEFGPGAKRAYQAAIDLVARDPRIAYSLSTTGQGNNPQVVLSIAKAGMRLRSAGKL